MASVPGERIRPPSEPVRRAPSPRETRMPQSPLPTAEMLERLAGDLQSVAFEFQAPAMSIGFAERRIAEVERICSAARAAVRGNLRGPSLYG